jgi:hypothetical protein
MDFETLNNLSRKDLQALAKSHGLKANKKSSILIEELINLDHQTFSSLKQNSTTAEEVDCPLTTSVRPLSPVLEKTKPIENVCMSELSPISSTKRSPSIKQLKEESRITELGAPDDDACDTRSADENCFLEKSFLNLSQNILTYGKISISTPSQDTTEDEFPVIRKMRSSSTGKRSYEENISCINANSDLKLFDGNKNLNIALNGIKTPAKSIAASIVPKSNKTQRLRREALAKKMEKTEALVAKVVYLQNFISISN